MRPRPTATLSSVREVEDEAKTNGDVEPIKKTVVRK